MMGERPYVSVRNVSKKFSRSLKRSFVFGAEDILRATFGQPLNQELRDSEFWALSDVSFDLNPGESVGIVGLNGSGKTTLLRIISGVLRQTRGEVTINGRLAPMIALGAGFKPVLSGRENIFLNMSLLGVPHREIKRRFEEVVDFAGIWDAIDAPLGTYSTGMQMRLGFACAVHTEPQILVIDEVLAVGDLRFRIKCRNKINDLRRQGVSMLIVSHSSISVETLTNHCIYLEKGRVKAQGEPAEVLRLYEADTVFQANAANQKNLEARQNADLRHTREIRESPVKIANLQLLNGSGAPVEAWDFGHSGQLAMTLSVAEGVGEISLNLIVTEVTDGPGENVQFLRTKYDIGDLDLTPPVSDVRLHLSNVGFKPGSYRAKLSVSQGEMDELLDVVEGFQFIVRPTPQSTNCQFYQPRQWIVDGAPRVSETISAEGEGEGEIESAEVF
jgi:lipopolysaccharide transport system ATP-binding protein